MDTIIGAAIALISGIVVQFFNNMQELKKEKKKLIFEKIQEIINSISVINDGMQKDMSIVLGLTNTNENIDKLSFEIPKLKCLVNIYHPQLSDETNKLVSATSNYFAAKRNYINAKNRKVSDADLKLYFQNIIDEFDLVVFAINHFIKALEEYGESKTI